jgi:hypothetical protein
VTAAASHNNALRRFELRFILEILRDRDLPVTCQYGWTCHAANRFAECPDSCEKKSPCRKIRPFTGDITGHIGFARAVPRLAAVISSSRKPVSAKQNLSQPRSRRVSIFCQLFGFALLFLPLPSRAQSLEDAAHELALKVCLAAHKQPVKVAWQESSSSGAYLSSSRKKAFLDQVIACGMDAADAPDAPVLAVTMQLTPSKVLLVAILAPPSGETRVFVVEVPRAALSAVREAAPAPQLRAELLWRQEKPVQSAIGWQDPATEERFLFLFGDGVLSRLRFEDGAWKSMDAAELQGFGRHSRSGDGSFFYDRSKEKIELALGKKVCGLNLDARLSLRCAAADVPDRAPEVLSVCEGSPRYLATGRGDYTQPDRITLGATSAGGTAASASIPAADESYAGSVDMPGPVLDLSVGENATAAFAVLKSLSTGNYEVYRITAVCGN